MERGTGKIVLSVFRIDSAELTPETRLPIGSLELSSDKPEFTFGRKHPPLETCKSLSAKALHLKLTKDNKIEVTRVRKNANWRIGPVLQWQHIRRFIPIERQLYLTSNSVDAAWEESSAARRPRKHGSLRSQIQRDRYYGSKTEIDHSNTTILYV